MATKWDKLRGDLIDEKMDLLDKVLKTVEKYCKGCLRDEPWNCPVKDCPLHPYRTPGIARKGMKEKEGE